MNAERYRKLKEIFNRAAEMTVAEREDFLENACDSDTLRREVEKMLGFADAEDSEDAFEKNAFELFSGDGHTKIPEKIGNYKIIGEIGRGGMGAVYEAVREADNFTQKAALKVIKRGMDTDAIVRRFRHEQKILATLEHPNIARFLDGGMTAAGLPFYAMEFVEGEFIDDYCRAKNLSVNERLRLFRQVCSAVQYAHQNLVIHRDLKSKNILVTGDGAPKLLDFGIAKVLTPETTEEIGTATQFGMMTPAYASPEQILGKRIGTTSDVYSLGVILYELLTGQKPYRINSNSQIEIEKAVLHGEPARPSSVVLRPLPIEHNQTAEQNKQRTKDKGQRTKLLKGDLDNIILKALRKEPAERYASVGQFSEDIRRYLEGLPVRARPHTVSYRATKFIKRNRIAVTAAVLIFLSLCVGITVAIWQAHRAQQQRILAEKRFADVRQLANSVVFKYHDAIADLEGSTAVREMLVKDALQYLDALAADAGGDNELKKELALAYLKLGDAQGKIYAANIGDTEGALASYRKSVALLEEVVRNAPADAKAKIDLIKAYDSLAFLMTRAGGNSRELVEKSLNLYDELEKLEPAGDERRMQLVDLLIRYGDTAAGFENSLREHLKAQAVAEKLVAADPHNTEKLRQLVRTNQRIGTDYQRLGDKARQENKPDAAREFFRQSLEYQRRMFAETEKLYARAPEKPANRRYLALAYINLSDSLGRNGHAEDALEMLEKARRILEEHLRRDPKNNETKFDLAEIFNTFADLYSEKGDYENFSQYLRKAFELNEEIYARDPKNLEVLNYIVERSAKLAEVYAQTGDAEKAKYFKQKNEDSKAKADALRKQKS
jgi:serine/threonine protein kinase/tetratricopeptide (TPR) repeat protein